MGVRFRLPQAECGAAHNHFDLVIDPVRDETVDGQCARDSIDDRQHVRAEVLLQRSVLKEVVQHDLRDRIAFEDDDEPLAGAAGCLVADVGDAGEPALLDEICDLDREVVRVDLVRQLRNHQARAALELVDADDGAHRDRTAAGAIGILNPLDAENLSARREVRALDASNESLEQFFARCVGVRQGPEGTRCDLAEIVGRDVRRHTDGDTDGTVDEQIGEARRKHVGLERLAVVVIGEVDGVLVDVPHHLHRERCHLRLGVPSGSCTVVTRRAEVTLAERERVAQVPGLHQAHECVVDRRVAVRVELPHHVTHHTRALRE